MATRDPKTGRFVKEKEPKKEKVNGEELKVQVIKQNYLNEIDEINQLLFNEQKNLKELKVIYEGENARLRSHLYVLRIVALTAIVGLIFELIVILFL